MFFGVLLILVMNYRVRGFPRQLSLQIPTASLEASKTALTSDMTCKIVVPKTNLGFDNLLEELTESLLKIMVYYSERIYFKISQGKRCIWSVR